MFSSWIDLSKRISTAFFCKTTKSYEVNLLIQALNFNKFKVYVIL